MNGAALCWGGARSACFTRAIAVNDAALRQVVRRDLEFDPVAQEQFDVVTAQAAGDVREHFVTVLQLDAERRARIDLLDRAEHLDHRLLRRFVDPFDPLRGRFAALGRPSRRARYDCTKESNFTRYLTNAGAQGLQPPDILSGLRDDPRLGRGPSQ